MTRNKISLISEPAVTIYLIPPINRRAICYLFKDYFNFTMIVTLMSQNPNKEIIPEINALLYFLNISPLYTAKIYGYPTDVAVSLLCVI